MRLGIAALMVSVGFGCGSGSGGGQGVGGTGGTGGSGGCANHDPCPGECNAQGWCSIDDVHMPLWVDVWGSAPDDVWLLPQDPSVYHFDGQSWTSMPIPTTYDVDRIWGRAPDDVWIGGGSGQIAHYDGVEWTAESIGPNERVQSFWSDGPAGPVLALGSTGTLYERGPSGWTVKLKLPESQTQGRSVNLLGCDGAHYATGAQLYSDVEGVWMGYGLSSSTDVEPVSATLALGSGRVWALVGKLMRYDGTSWRSNVADFQQEPFVAIAGTSEQDAWALTADQRLLHSDGTGFTEALGSSQVGGAKWIHGAAPGVVDLADESGNIARYDGSSVTSFASGGLSGTPLGFTWAPSGEPLALTSSGLYTVATGASTWTELDSVFSLSGTEASISASSIDDVWCAVGNQLLHWNGTDLVQTSAGLNTTQYRAVLAISPSDVWAASSEETAHFDGASWTKLDSDPTLPTGSSQARTALVANAPNDVWIIRDRNRFAHWNGSHFTLVPQHDQLGTIGCGESAGDLIGLGIQPAPLYAGKPGAMQEIAPSFVEGYGVSEGWIGALDDIWVLGYDPNGPGKQILRYDGTFSVSSDASGHGLIALWAFPGGEAWAVGYNVILHHLPH